MRVVRHPRPSLARARRSALSSRAESPKWADQQGELAKWLVGLSTGLIGFGVLAVKDEPLAADLRLLTASDVALVTAIGAALFFVFSSNTFARLRHAGRTAGAITWPSIIRGISFPVMLVAFFLGNAFFLAFGLFYLQALAVAPPDPSPPPLVIHAIAAGPRNTPMLVAQRGETLWVIRGCDLSKGAWTPMPSPPESPKPKDG